MTFDDQPGLFSHLPVATQLEQIDEDIPLRFEWADEITASLGGNWLVKDWFPKEGVALVYGHSRAGKSLLVLDLAFAVATAQDWNGLKTQGGFVAYVAAEGAHGIKQRIAAIRKGRVFEQQTKLALIPEVIDLFCNSSGTADLLFTVNKLAGTMNSKPALVVIDTLSKTLGDGEENTNDLARYVRNCEHIAQQLQCCVIIIHHRPKDRTSREPRGHSSLAAGVDTMILVDRQKRNTASVVKQKDGPEGSTMTFSMRPVCLGYDENGDDVNSVVIDQIKTERVDGLQEPAQRFLRANLKVMLDLIEDCIDGGIVEKIDVGSEGEINTIIAVKLKALRERFETGADKKPDTIRKAFDRDIESLKKLNFIDKSPTHCWLCV